MQFDTFPFTIVVGAVVGFLGAIPPGPLNVTIIKKASTGQKREAYRVALGGALVDATICAFIGLGFGWILEKVVTKKWVKAGLALFIAAYGLKIVLVDRKKEERLAPQEKDEPEPPEEHDAVERRIRLPLLTGLLQGAANPAVLVNWTFLISFLVGHHIVKTTIPSVAGFAGGVGIGVFGWFALVIALLERFRDHPIGAWLRRSTVYAGVLLILFGAYFTLKSFVEVDVKDLGKFLARPGASAPRRPGR